MPFNVECVSVRERGKPSERRGEGEREKKNLRGNALRTSLNIWLRQTFMSVLIKILIKGHRLHFSAQMCLVNHGCKGSWGTYFRLEVQGFLLKLQRHWIAHDHVWSKVLDTYVYTPPENYTSKVVKIGQMRMCSMVYLFLTQSQKTGRIIIIMWLPKCNAWTRTASGSMLGCGPVPAWFGKVKVCCGHWPVMLRNETKVVGAFSWDGS